MAHSAGGAVWYAGSVREMSPLDLVRLSPLMERGEGSREIAVALIDGPVALGLPELATAAIREVGRGPKGACARAETPACSHGTFVAAMLFARRGSGAPAICPGCTLLVRPIFAERANGDAGIPSARPEELAAAIVESVDAGARVINISSALVQASPKSDRAIDGALSHALRRGAIAVAAAGNQGIVGSSTITRHPWVIPVAACDLAGRALRESNLGRSIGARGLTAPGADITSLRPDGSARTSGGTSAAAPFVTGAVALLWSEFPGASAAQIRWAVAGRARRASIAPPLLDAWAAHAALASACQGRRAS